MEDDGRPVEHSRERSASGWWGLLVLAGVGLVVPLAVAGHFGAFGIPRGDDWSYLQTLFRFADHGRLDGNHWVSMTLVGQVGITTPVVWVFGHSIRAAQVTAALMGFGGLTATYWLARPLLGRRPATIVVVSIAVCPLWGVLVVSYMTDVPAYGPSMLALALGAAAVRRVPVAPGLLTAALVVGVFAFSIRQYAIVPVVAIGLTALLVAWGSSDRERFRSVAAIGLAAILACVVIYGLWSRIPNLKTYVPAAPNGHSISVTIIKSGGFLRLAGLFLAPVVIVANPIRVVRRALLASRAATLVIGIGTAAALVALSVRVPGQQFVGNYVDASGALSTDVLLGRRPDLFPGVVYALLVAAATMSAVVLVLALVDPFVRVVARWRTRDLVVAHPDRFVVGLAVIGYVLAYEFAMITGVSVYDRYALPVLPLVAIAFLASTRAGDAVVPNPTTARAGGAGWGRASIAAVALLALVGFAFMVDSASFDGTRWKVADTARQAGFASRRINGGFEWVNFYRGDHVPRIVVGDKDRPREAPKTRPSEFCVSVVVDPPKDGRPVVAVRKYEALTRPAARIVALRNVHCRGR
ncbi:MAG: hypothetical protein ABJC79_02360 [Acidimicrobiia bacterium]